MLMDPRSDAEEQLKCDVSYEEEEKQCEKSD
jgi:hypothetical protein